MLYVPDADIAARAAVAAASKPTRPSSSSTSSALPALTLPLLFVVKAARNETIGGLKVSELGLVVMQ